MVERSDTVLAASSSGEIRLGQARKFPETAGSKQPVVEYALPRDVEENLDRHQKRALSYMVRAARRIADIYILQQRPKTADPREPFYPKDVSESEIREAARNDPAILSPYTIVIRTEEGRLKAVPQHRYYQEIIKEKGIVELLQNAAKEIRRSKHKDPQLESFLRARAIAFQTGEFETSEAIWLTRGDEPEINIVIGFYDTYSDRFLGIKYAAQAWVDVFDPDTNVHVQWFQKRILELQEEKTGQPSPKINSRVAFLRIAAGQAEPYDWTGQSMPCQPEWRQKYGSRLTIWKEPLEKKFRDEKLPAFRRFINPLNVRGIQDGWLRLANLRTHAGHEIAHGFLVNEKVDELQQHKNWIKELQCDLLALENYRLIQEINPRESEVAMALKLAQSYVEYEDREKRREYHESSTVLLNYLIEKGSIWIENGFITWSDTQQVFDDIGDLRAEVEDIIDKERRGQARELEDKYFKPDVYDYLIAKISYPPPLQKEADSVSPQQI